MKLVRENITDFKRGMDPKESMDLNPLYSVEYSRFGRDFKQNDYLGVGTMSELESFLNYVNQDEDYVIWEPTKFEKFEGDIDELEFTMTKSTDFLDEAKIIRVNRLYENITDFKRITDPKEAMNIDRPKVTHQNKEDIEFEYRGKVFNLLYDKEGKILDDPLLWDLFHVKDKQHDWYHIMSFHNDYEMEDLIEIVKDEIEKYYQRINVS